MNVSDIAGILARLPNQPAYVTQEVVWGKGQPVTPNMYTPIGTFLQLLWLMDPPVDLFQLFQVMCKSECFMCYHFALLTDRMTWIICPTDFAMRPP